MNYRASSVLLYDQLLNVKIFSSASVCSLFYLVLVFNIPNFRQEYTGLVFTKFLGFDFFTFGRNLVSFRPVTAQITRLEYVILQWIGKNAESSGSSINRTA